MASKPLTENWDLGLEGKHSRSSISGSSYTPRETANREQSHPPTHEIGREIWINPGLWQLEETDNLDEQPAYILFFLGLVKDVSLLNSVYVEKVEDGSSLVWTVIKEIDYDIMDEIYEIERNTLERFPLAKVDFRVTIESGNYIERGEHARKIYETD